MLLITLNNGAFATNLGGPDQFLDVSYISQPGGQAQLENCTLYKRYPGDCMKDLG